MATNEQLLAEIDEMKGWVLHLLRLEMGRWAKENNLAPDAPETRARFMEELHETGRAWTAKVAKRRDPGPDAEGAVPEADHDPLSPNVTPLHRF